MPSPAPGALPIGSDAENELEADPDASQAEQRRLDVTAADHGQRLDRLLAAAAPEFSRSHLQGLVEAGHVLVDSLPCTHNAHRMRAGQSVRVTLVPTAESLSFRPQPMLLNILHEDDHLLVVDKPAGLVVHPAAGNWSGTLLNGILAHHAAASRLPRAGIVHRLDKDTSGVMVVGKTLEAVTALVRDIAERQVLRQYRAIAWGLVEPARQRIDAPIGRDPAQRTRMAVVSGGRPAQTDVDCLAHQQGLSALQCRLHTGRTHQIRVHLASRRHPLVADAVYGGQAALGLQRQALHAVHLAFAHPISRQPMAFDCPPPPDFAAAWSVLLPD
ncbi:MAG: RluA family pseudouridine synthase [Rubrivivax sp.]|nr:RluA family pseudouridine synthase [Rubrivivax sp.]MBK7263952.1 RluA family pseudouridine synthase [Rubrivivax sp.]MBK8526621.1 RluA family pseudouridine synthase [Rubrivivax sp.]